HAAGRGGRRRPRPRRRRCDAGDESRALGRSRHRPRRARRRRRSDGARSRRAQCGGPRPRPAGARSGQLEARRDPAAADRRMIRIVAVGDSTTAGTPAFTSPREAPPNGDGDVTSQYAYWLMKTHADWEVVNQGVNAQRSDLIAARFDADVIAKRPAVVVIIAGVHD